MFNPADFFAALRPAPFGRLTASQVSGIEDKLAAMRAAGWPISFAAYGLATSAHETGKTMQPVREIGKGAGKPYGRPGRNGGQIPYGRGDVQLTHDVNYERADRELKLNGRLIANYDLALDPEISARIMVRGMAEGWFTGKKLSNYLPGIGNATFEMFRRARRVINGTDKDAEIAVIALQFQAALLKGEW
jgi:hypothetical protein